MKKGDRAPTQEKWAAIKASRKANDLCYTCGEKWTGRNHKCPDQVPIHMIQELMEMFQLDDCSNGEEDSSNQTDEVIMTVKEDQPDQEKQKREEQFDLKASLASKKFLFCSIQEAWEHLLVTSWSPLLDCKANLVNNSSSPLLMVVQ